MSCKYIILKNTLTDVYYPVAISDGSALSTKALTKLITKRCTVTRADALAVITAMVEVINETLAGGRSVHVDGMGYLKLKLKATGVKSLADFDFQKQLTAVRIQLTPDREQPLHAKRLKFHYHYKRGLRLGSRNRRGFRNKRNLLGICQFRGG